MPDEPRGAEAKFITGLLQAPAKVDVIARLTENRIEVSNLFQGAFEESHVATGDMFGLAVGEHDVGGAAGRNHDGGGDGGVFGGKQVGAADAGELAARQRAHEVIKPIFI